MNRDVKSITVKRGLPANISASGRFFKILRTSPVPALVAVQSNQGQTDSIVPGVQIEYEHAIKSLTLTCPNAIQDITILYYAGDFPWSGAAITQPDGSLMTFDWVTTNTNGALNGTVVVNGTLTLNGTTYRRKSVTVVNLTGLGAPYNVAQLAAVTSNFSGANSLAALGAGFAQNNGGYPLTPATATQVFPFTLETDDTIYLAPTGAVAKVDFEIVQTWVPILST